jgi:hypothetical protein
MDDSNSAATRIVVTDRAPAYGYLIEIDAIAAIGRNR